MLRLVSLIVTAVSAEEITVQLYRSNAQPIGVNLQVQLRNLGFNKDFTDEVLAVQRQLGKPDFYKLFTDPSGDIRMTDIQWAGAPDGPVKKAAMSSVPRDTARGLAATLEHVLSFKEVRLTKPFQMPQQMKPDDPQTGFVNPDKYRTQPCYALEERKQCVFDIVQRVTEPTHLSYAIKAIGGHSFTPGKRGLKRTATNWLRAIELAQNVATTGVTAGDIGLTQEELNAFSGEDVHDFRGTLMSVLPHRIVPDDAWDRPSIYHESRDVAFELAQSWKENGVLDQFGLADSVASTMMVPGIPMFFSADENGVEVASNGQFVFHRTEDYAAFSGNQDTDGGVHISVLNRLPNEEAVSREQGYDAPNAEKLDALMHQLATGQGIRHEEDGSGTYILDANSGEKIYLSVTFDLDMTKGKIVNGGQRNDAATGGISYIAALVPKSMGDKIRSLQKYLDVPVDASQQFHISLAMHSPSYLPHAKSPYAISAGWTRAGALSASAAWYWNFRRGVRGAAFHIGDGKGMSATDVTAWEHYEMVANFPSGGLPAAKAPMSERGLGLPQAGCDALDILPFMGFKASIELESVHGITDDKSMREFNDQYNPTTVFNGKALSTVVPDVKAEKDSLCAKWRQDYAAWELRVQQWADDQEYVGFLSAYEVAKGLGAEELEPPEEPALCRFPVEELRFQTTENPEAAKDITRILVTGVKDKFIIPLNKIKGGFSAYLAADGKETKVLASVYKNSLPTQAEQARIIMAAHQGADADARASMERAMQGSGKDLATIATLASAEA